MSNILTDCFAKRDKSINFFWIFWRIDAIITLAAILGGSYWLQTHQHETGARILLAILAVPGLFFLVVILVNPRWS